MARAYISIGSNIAPEVHVPQALCRLARAVRVTRISTFYRNPALGPPDQPPFYNGVVEIETGAPPQALKYCILRGIETAMGRVRTAERNAPRPIDLDILLYADCVVREEDIAIPDPTIAERPFLAIPLYELAPDLVMPDSGIPLRTIVAPLTHDGLEALDAWTAELRKEVADEYSQR